MFSYFVLGLRDKLSLSEQANSHHVSTVTKLESRVNALENELSNKDSLLSKTQDLLSGEQEQKVSSRVLFTVFLHTCHPIQYPTSTFRSTTIIPKCFSTYTEKSESKQSSNIFDAYSVHVLNFVDYSSTQCVVNRGNGTVNK